MEIVADAVIPYRRALVFATYRDRLPDLVRYLPNIREITVRSRTERGDEIDLINEWKGGGDIPAVARSFLSESMLTWTDHATWFERDHRVTWRTDIHAFPAAVKSTGENHFIEIPEGTRFELRGTFTCDVAPPVAPSGGCSLAPRTSTGGGFALGLLGLLGLAIVRRRRRAG